MVNRCFPILRLQISDAGSVVSVWWHPMSAWNHIGYGPASIKLFHAFCKLVIDIQGKITYTNKAGQFMQDDDHKLQARDIRV